MPETKRDVNWCRQQIGPGHERFSDAQIQRIQSMLEPVIQFALTEAEKQWKTSRKL